MTDGRFAEQLESPFHLSPEAIEAYRRDGYVKLPAVFAPALLEHYRRAISASVEKLAGDRLPFEQHRFTVDNLQNPQDYPHSPAFSCKVRFSRSVMFSRFLVRCTSVVIQKRSSRGMLPRDSRKTCLPPHPNLAE